MVPRRARPRARGHLFALLSAVCTLGCAHYPRTVALAPGAGTELLNQVQHAQSSRAPELQLGLVFSGGGTRAAALSYGVLETLADVEVNVLQTRRRLLDEVDTISSVSGGSFTAAYFGLYGDRIFEDYEHKFLKHNVERGLVFGGVFAPVNWLRLPSPWYGRGDVAAAYYDRLLFGGATFADLWDANGPYIQIQATDIAQGTTFSFTPEQFELICVDLAQFPIARAVAASSCFPAAFTPITIKNHAGECDSRVADGLRTRLSGGVATRRAYHNAREWRAYSDADERRYIHLMDGGISDNLGLRGPLDLVILEGATQRFQRLGMHNVRRIAVIVVNAQQPNMEQWGRRDAPPGVVSVLSAMSGFQLTRYAFETIDLLEQSLREWAAELEAADPDGRPVETYVIEVNLAALQDTRGGFELPFIPTRLSLPAETVDTLRKVARQLLWESPDFRRLVRDLGGQVPAAADEAAGRKP